VHLFLSSLGLHKRYHAPLPPLCVAVLVIYIYFIGQSNLFFALRDHAVLGPTSQLHSGAGAPFLALHTVLRFIIHSHSRHGLQHKILSVAFQSFEGLEMLLSTCYHSCIHDWGALRSASARGENTH